MQHRIYNQQQRTSDGAMLDDDEGKSVGDTEGEALGSVDGDTEGLELGKAEGAALGCCVILTSNLRLMSDEEHEL